ncbi:MAG: VCBS repeat-containing protein [Oscillospiraceae bacterium]|nr:VCBS repeat-containing protein [Oscillospiraceae bacterium]
MIRKIRSSLLLCGGILLGALLSGCTFNSTAESLFTLPQLPIEYTDLSRQISELIADGYEYASPASGRNIQSVQMVDLDGDGDEEAVAFFRRSSDEKPLKIFIFRANDDTYDRLCTIESSGTSVDSVSYRDLTGDGQLELVVGWRISSDVQTVAVYHVAAEPAVLLQSGYVRYSIEELDGDGIPSLLLLRSDESGGSVAEFYSWREDSMTAAYITHLSGTMADLTQGGVVSGKLDEETPAVFVTGVNAENVAVTDVLIFRQGSGLVNVAIDRWTGSSGVAFPYMQLRPQDINGDGITEIPSPASDPVSDGLIHWLQLDSYGKTKVVSTTYHSASGGWYFTLPQEWRDRVSVESYEISANEWQLLIQVDKKAVAAVYTLTGENRENRAMRGNRVILRRQTATVYAGEILFYGADWDLTEDFLRQNFHLTVQQWTNLS